MITLRKSAERRREQSDRQDAWHTFDPDAPAPLSKFGAMEAFREGRFARKEAEQEAYREAEILTYVREGALGFEDSLGQTGVLHAGDFQRMTTGVGLRYGEMNVSSAQETHSFQVRLSPGQLGLAPGYERRHFGVAYRRGHLCCVASPDGAAGSLVLHQNASLFSAILAPGQHVVHELAGGRGAWLHVVEGSLSVGSLVLNTGDGAGLNDEISVSITAREMTELLLLDLGGFGRPLVPSNGTSAIHARPSPPTNGSSTHTADH